MLRPLLTWTETSTRGSPKDHRPFFPPMFYGERQARGPVQTLPGSIRSLAVENVKEGGLADRDGQICVRRGSQLEPLAIPVSVAQEFAECSRCVTRCATCSETQLAATTEETTS